VFAARLTSNECFRPPRPHRKHSFEDSGAYDAPTSGQDADDAEVTIGALGVEVLSMSAADGAAAGLFRAEHYGPTGRTLSLADSFAAVTTIATGRRLATADPVLLQCVTSAGGQCVELPPSG
jgi:hypothetical protein